MIDSVIIFPFLTIKADTLPLRPSHRVGDVPRIRAQHELLRQVHGGRPRKDGLALDHKPDRGGIAGGPRAISHCQTEYADRGPRKQPKR